MHSKPGRILLLLAFLILFAACGDGDRTIGPTEVTLHMDLPDPLAESGVGMEVSPDSTLEIISDITVDVGSIAGDLNDVVNIVIAIIPAVVSFDTTPPPLSCLKLLDPPALHEDGTIMVSFYFSGSGMEDPFQEEFHAASFYISIEDNEVTDVSEAIDIPQQLSEYIYSGNPRVGIELESNVRGWLVIESADLTFFF
jgi:hypothetical protein